MRKVSNNVVLSAFSSDVALGCNEKLVGVPGCNLATKSNIGYSYLFIDYFIIKNLIKNSLKKIKKK